MSLPLMLINCDRVLQVPKAFSGGPEAFWSLVWSSHVSSFDKLEDHLEIVSPPGDMCQDLALALRDQSASPKALLLDFLRGRGIPCPEHFNDVKDTFDSIVHPQLELIDEPGFRARMFTWATTGTTSLVASDKIKVSLRSRVLLTFLWT